ncbi:MAG: DUF5317 domain-containing protein [Tissierellia bacterium]|nr:DUF5317 domain-containing protein [Tissierellia bacterium]
MFIEPSFLAIVITKFKGGKLKNLENVEIKGFYLITISALLQLSLSLIKKTNVGLTEIINSNYLIYIILSSYILLIIVALLNINKFYMKLFLIGILLNLVVIMANNGKMPVSITGLKGIYTETELPEREFDIKHINVNKDTKLRLLADIILIDKPYPLPKILSIGDLFIMGGVFFFFHTEMLREKIIPYT